MIIIYTPEGCEPEQYDAGALKVSEVSIVQRTIDQTWTQIKAGLPEEDLDAMRGIAWVLKKRTHPSLRWGDFDPGVDEMTTRFDNKEVRAYIENALAIRATDPTITNEAMAEALSGFPDAAVDPAMAEALIKELIAASPKDLPPEAPVDEEGTTSPSPTSTSPEPSGSDSSASS
ncbi:hypothetical protein [Streptomyces sp. H27-C3]|uniref:hypothetical protein n=1 Tax=Streptomyces sp. H27-C3 TaxID=3046305 RepID=UPI0024BBC648|nr:hypothetical protein [Streptomyces sp. H27-C3]MDJ0461552.1 hypothetical protein [Streptomyces sp. H27-C3]